MVRLSGLLKKVSNDDIWVCWCIILQKRAGINKMDYRMLRRKYLLGCLGKLGDSGDLRQGSSNNSVTNFVQGFPYVFQREK